MTRKQFKWGELLLGLLFVAIGVLTLVYPTFALTVVVVAVAITAIAKGISRIAFFVKFKRRTGIGPTMSLLGGILDILLGILFLFNINAGMFFFGFLFAMWFFIDCIANLSNMWFLATFGSWQYVLHIILNVIGLILAVLLFLNPFTSTITLAYLIGFYFILMGVVSIITAFATPKEDPFDDMFFM